MTDMVTLDLTPEEAKELSLTEAIFLNRVLLIKGTIRINLFLTESYAFS